MNNPYWDNISQLAQKQREKGLETYGVGIEDNPMDITERIRYLQEELIDALMYCEWIKDKLGQSGWISVEDRLPEQETTVLTLCKFGHAEDRRLRKFRNGELLFSPDGLEPGRDITHWMPFPEFPKEEK